MGGSKSKPAKAAPGSLGHRPSKAEIAAARLLLEPWHWLTAPVFYGAERVPTERPVLVVANHTVMGVLDVPLLVFGLYERRGVLLRSLGDHLHFQVPVWRDLLMRFGTVDGTRDNCRALMRSGESILVFPGGGREVFKHKGEKYKLIWKERMGFARLAIEFGYPIVPAAAVGAEECYDIVLDGDELVHSPIGPLLERLAPRPDEIPPLVRGIGPLPRPERFYFHFGRPIETRHLSGRGKDDAVCLALRERVRRGVQRGIRLLLDARERDPEHQLLARLLAQLRGLSGAAVRPHRGRPRRSRSTEEAT